MENILFDKDGTEIIDKIEKNRSESFHMQPTIYSREHEIGR